MSSSNLNPSPFANQRRSQRILLAVRILVTGQRDDQSAFTEKTSTLIVNAHGAMFHLRESVRSGQTLNIRHVTTQEEMLCKVVDVSPSSNGSPEVGVEFTEPNARFWRVSFPPADWTPRSAEAKRFTSTSVAAQRPVQPSSTKK